MTQASPVVAFDERIHRSFLCETWRARWQGREVIAKTLCPKLLPHAALEAWFVERHRLLQDFSHPHAVRQLAFLENDPPAVLFEPLSGLSLAEYLFRNNPPLNTKTWVPWLRQALTVLSVLQHHLPGFVHGDLSLENSWLVPSPSPHGEDGVPRYDFVLLDLGGLFDPYAPGNFQTLAPERANGEAASQASDLFALGALFYRLATGCELAQSTKLNEGNFLFGNEKPTSKTEILRRMEGFNLSAYHVALSRLDDQARALLGPLLHPDPQHRTP